MVLKHFFNGITMNVIGKIAHVLNHSHVICVLGAFDKNLHEGYFWNGARVVPYFFLRKSIFLHFVHNGMKFYNKYI